MRTSRLRQSGHDLVEYGLIIFLVAVVVIAVLLTLGEPIGRVFSGINAAI